MTSEFFITVVVLIAFVQGCANKIPPDSTVARVDTYLADTTIRDQQHITLEVRGIRIDEYGRVFVDLVAAGFATESDLWNLEALHKSIADNPAAWIEVSKPNHAPIALKPFEHHAPSGANLDPVPIFGYVITRDGMRMVMLPVPVANKSDFAVDGVLVAALNRHASSQDLLNRFSRPVFIDDAPRTFNVRKLAIEPIAPTYPAELRTAR